MTDYPVPPISQRTVKLCWEACGHMLWDWRHREDAGMRARYAQTAGHYTSLDTGLAAAQMDKFYRRLGLRSLWKAKGANVRYALQWSPVIVTSVLEQRGHAMVVAGTNNGQYTLINPCFLASFDFTQAANDSCSVGNTRMNEAELDGSLGEAIWYW